MHQGAALGMSQPFKGSLSINVCPIFRHALVFSAGIAHGCGNGTPLLQGFSKKIRLPCWIAYQRTESQIFNVAKAKQIAMRQHDALSKCSDDRRIIQKMNTTKIRLV